MIDIRNYFAPSVLYPGLQITVQAGIVLVNGSGVLVPTQNISVPANSTSYVYVNTITAAIQVAGSFPLTDSYPIAIVVTGTAVNSLTDARPDISAVPSAAGPTPTVSMVASGLTTGSSTGTYISNLTISGAGVASIGVGDGGTITISVPAAAAGNVNITALGNTTSSSAGTFQNILNFSGAGIASVGVGAGSVTISVPAPAAATNFNLNGTSSSVSIAAGANIGIGQANSTITISASVQTSSISLTAVGNTTISSAGTFSNLLNISGAGIASVGVGAGSVTISVPAPAASANVVSSLNGSTGALSLSAGVGIGIGQANSTITISASNQTSLLPARISYTENCDLNQAAPVSIGLIASTGITAATAAANPFGSSMSLQRLYLPAAMNISEVDLALAIAFPATNQGAGSLSQSFVAYTFGNSTSLASVLSASRAVTWTSGTTTAGVASTLQQGWAGNNIQPFTFASSTMSAGEYVFAHLLQWAAVNTSWTISLYGANAASNSTTNVVTNVASGSLSAASTFATASQTLTAFTATPTVVNALSSTGLLGASAHTASASSSLTAWSAAPSVVNALSSTGLAAASGITASTTLATNNAGNVFWGVSRASSLTSSVASATSSFTFLQVGFVSSLGTLAGSIHSASASGIALSNAGTIAFPGFMGSGGLLAGSFITASASGIAISNAGTLGLGLASSMTTNVVSAVTGVSTLAAVSTIATDGIVNWSYNGTFNLTTSTSVASYLSGPFMQGIFLSGGSAASLALSSTAAIVTGSIALIQPWFALAGA